MGRVSSPDDVGRAAPNELRRPPASGVPAAPLELREDRCFLCLQTEQAVGLLGRQHAPVHDRNRGSFEGRAAAGARPRGVASDGGDEAAYQAPTLSMCSARLQPHVALKPRVEVSPRFHDARCDAHQRDAQSDRADSRP